MAFASNTPARRIRNSRLSMDGTLYNDIVGRWIMSHDDMSGHIVDYYRRTLNRLPVQARPAGCEQLRQIMLTKGIADLCEFKRRFWQ